MMDEKTLKAAWASVANAWGSTLGVAVVGSEDDFFELGGDSLLAMVMMSYLNEEGWEAGLQIIFEHSTAGDFTKALFEWSSESDVN